MKRSNFKKIAFANHVESLFRRELGAFLFSSSVADISQSEIGSVRVYCTRDIIPFTFLKIASKVKDCYYYVTFDNLMGQCVLVFVPRFV